jgi:hypothetical protein
MDPSSKQLVLTILNLIEELKKRNLPIMDDWSEGFDSALDIVIAKIKNLQ